MYGGLLTLAAAGAFEASIYDEPGEAAVVAGLFGNARRSLVGHGDRDRVMIDPKPGVLLCGNAAVDTELYRRSACCRKTGRNALTAAAVIAPDDRARRIGIKIVIERMRSSLHRPRIDIA